LREGNWYGALRDGELFDLIVSNPPYVESEIIEELMPDVRDFDPALALDGGPDGLHAYRAIAKGAARWLKPGGTLMVEIGSEQGLEVGALFAALGLTQVEIKKDLAGLDRVVIGHHVLL
jgi:release factor glutamine methyltransferase